MTKLTSTQQHRSSDLETESDSTAPVIEVESSKPETDDATEETLSESISSTDQAPLPKSITSADQDYLPKSITSTDQASLPKSITSTDQASLPKSITPTDQASLSKQAEVSHTIVSKAPVNDANSMISGKFSNT